MGDDPLEYRGMIFYERQAVERALRETRERWLPVLEDLLVATNKPSEQLRFLAEITRLRRLLGIKPSAEARRAATRERVRRHRERKRQGIVLGPRREPKTTESIVADAKR
jgi:hypothetical protein